MSLGKRMTARSVMASATTALGVDADRAAAGEGEPQSAGAGDDVMVGQHVAGPDDEARADADLQVAGVLLGIVERAAS